MRSHKFEYVRGWTHETENNNIELTLKELGFEDGQEVGALLFKRGNDGYAKMMIEGSMNLLTELSTQRLLSMNKQFDSDINEGGFNIEFVYMLQELGMFLGYFVNSTSWQDQKLHIYDAMELSKRIERVANRFKQPTKQTLT